MFTVCAITKFVLLLEFFFQWLVLNLKLVKQILPIPFILFWWVLCVFISHFFIPCLLLFITVSLESIFSLKLLYLSPDMSLSSQNSTVEPHDRFKSMFMCAEIVQHLTFLSFFLILFFIYRFSSKGKSHCVRRSFLCRKFTKHRSQK